MRLAPARRLAVILAVVVTVLAAAALVVFLPRQPPHDGELQALSRELQPAVSQEREITAGEVHRFRFEANRDDSVDVVVDQLAGDVVVSLVAQDGARLLRSDGPAGDRCQEYLRAVVERRGAHFVEVETHRSDRPAAYRIRLAELRPASEQDRLIASASQLLAEGDTLLQQKRYGAALAHYQGSCLLWEQASDRLRHADCIARVGLCHSRMGDNAGAAELLEQGAAVYQAEQQQSLAAWALNLAGTKSFRAGVFDRAGHAYQNALELCDRLDDRRCQLASVHGLARVHQVRDEVQRALDFYARMEGLLAQLPDDPKRRALVLHNKGALYLDMGELDRAFEALSQAEALFAEIDEWKDRASSLNRLGVVCRQRGDLDAALVYHQQALAIRLEIRDQRGEGATLNQIGYDHLARGEPAEAITLLERALELHRALDNPRSQAHVLLNLGMAQLALQGPQAAQEAYAEALELFRSLNEPSGIAESLLGQARALADLGRLHDAVRASGEALELLETLRTRPASFNLRMSFFATVQQYFDLHIDLLMRLHGREPGAGHAAAALVAAERARAQLLVDLLRESGAGLRAAADPELLQRELAAQKKLNALEQTRLRLVDSTQRSGSGALTEVERSIQATLHELDEIRGRIRVDSPRQAALVAPRTPDIGELQSRVLDPDTVLLEYRLGDERSFLWKVSTGSVQGFELAPRSDIERAVRTAYDLLGRSQHPEAAAATQIALCDLSSLVLGPLADELDPERLVVVADGVLQYIPFAALPDPAGLGSCRETEPLVLGHEIVYAPSASVLALLDAPPQHTEYRGQLAVIADPVFSSDDPRLSSNPAEPVTTPTLLAMATGGSDLERAGGAVGLDELARLPYSRLESELILAMVPAERRLGITGPAARKEVVTGDHLAGFQVVHFATHGILHPYHPQLSGIVLSLVDDQGQPVDGFLREHEIYNLQLPCELVVLSACQTALGQEVRGEGLMSLARGFMYAGAQQVMVSLWRVSDSGTAELMQRFYRFMFSGGLAPAAALRQAQISMYRDQRRAAPYYWAPFVVQGTWRAHRDERGSPD